MSPSKHTQKSSSKSIKWVAKEDSWKSAAKKDSRSDKPSTSILQLLQAASKAQLDDVQIPFCQIPFRPMSEAGVATAPPVQAKAAAKPARVVFKAANKGEDPLASATGLLSTAVAKVEKRGPRRISEDEETVFESEEGVPSSSDESWNSHQDQLQTGHAAGKQLLSLLKQPKKIKERAKSTEPEAAEASFNSKPGRTKLSLSAAAFCPEHGTSSWTDHLLDRLRSKLAVEQGSSDSPRSGDEASLEILQPESSGPVFHPQALPKVLQQQSCEPAFNQQALPKALQSPSMNPVQKKDTAAPPSKPERTPLEGIRPENIAAPPSKPLGRTPLGKTPLSFKAAIFQPGKLNFDPVPDASAPFKALHSGMCQPYFPQIPNGFKLGFSSEMPQYPPGALQKPCAEDTAPMPFECLIGKYQVSNGILVSKDNSPEDSPHLEEVMPTSGDSTPRYNNSTPFPQTPEDSPHLEDAIPTSGDSTPRYNDSAPFPQLLPAALAGRTWAEVVDKDSAGVAPCSPASTATPVLQQKTSWADLSDDVEASPWMQLAIEKSLQNQWD